MRESFDNLKTPLEREEYRLESLKRQLEEASRINPSDVPELSEEIKVTEENILRLKQAPVRSGRERFDEIYKMLGKQ
jgi:hypothetical protein